ncbi:hypothetical protein HMPREF0045_00051 [Actinomyces graevenitzii C83]|uniref:Uncharacterized protein n=1 Tax=Actinomyces graevenitzii C83 TaxID=435830 RepID=G9PDG8_9ACTO|nr:hypothetical protein [Actinomyces graevenitzii]EHM89386.1 hypothetical protein HMPREF0045_00051 [Actinomyces graevenitzii C83]
MSAYDPRQRREPAAPENSQQNGYFSAPTASGSAIPATPGQQPTAAFQAPYDGACEQPPTAFNASGQAPYNSVEPDPVAYQPTQAMPPVGSQPAGGAHAAPPATQAMDPIDAFTPEPTQAMPPVIQPKSAGQDLPYATQAMAPVGSQPAGGAHAAPATRAMPAATQAMPPIDAQEALPPSVSPRRGRAAGAVGAGAMAAGGAASAAQRPPSVPPGSIPPGSIPPGSVPPSSIPPGGPLTDDEPAEDEEPTKRSKFMLWFILALLAFLAVCFAIAWSATGNSVPDPTPSAPAVITPSLDSTATPAPTSTTKPLSKSSPSPTQENNNNNNNNNQPVQPSQPEYTQPPQQNYPSAPSQPSYTSPSPYPNDPGNDDDDDDNDDDDGNNYIVPGPGDPNNSNS